VDLKAGEAAAEIKRAYVRGLVEEDLCGDWNTVRTNLGVAWEQTQEDTSPISAARAIADARQLAQGQQLAAGDGRGPADALAPREPRSPLEASRPTFDPHAADVTADMRIGELARERRGKPGAAESADRVKKRKRKQARKDRARNRKRKRR
jgi:hypothetical protein